MGGVSFFLEFFHKKTVFVMRPLTSSVVDPTGPFEDLATVLVGLGQYWLVLVCLCACLEHP